jgi:hypothetical protein
MLAVGSLAPERPKSSFGTFLSRPTLDAPQLLGDFGQKVLRDMPPASNQRAATLVKAACVNRHGNVSRSNVELELFADFASSFGRTQVLAGHDFSFSKKTTIKRSPYYIKYQKSPFSSPDFSLPNKNT